jgi:hypothetical protein
MEAASAAWAVVVGEIAAAADLKNQREFQGNLLAHTETNSVTA